MRRFLTAHWSDAFSGFAATPGNDVARILDGARPRDLPAQQPKKYEIAFNAAIAKALGLTFPRAVRLRADKVIE